MICMQKNPSGMCITQFVMWVPMLLRNLVSTSFTLEQVLTKWWYPCVSSNPEDCNLDTHHSLISVNSFHYFYYDFHYTEKVLMEFACLNNDIYKILQLYKMKDAKMCSVLVPSSSWIYASLDIPLSRTPCQRHKNYQ